MLQKTFVLSQYVLQCTNGDRPLATGWYGVANATPRQQDASFLPPLGVLCNLFIAALSLLLRRRDFQRFGWVQPLSLRCTRVFNLFLHTYYPFDSDNMKYEKTPHILCHVILLRRFCHPWNMDLVTGLNGERTICSCSHVPIS